MARRMLLQVLNLILISLNFHMAVTSFQDGNLIGGFISGGACAFCIGVTAMWTSEALEERCNG